MTNVCHYAPFVGPLFSRRNSLPSSRVGPTFMHFISARDLSFKELWTRTYRTNTASWHKPSLLTIYYKDRELLEVFKKFVYMRIARSFAIILLASKASTLTELTTQHQSCRWICRLSSIGKKGHQSRLEIGLGIVNMIIFKNRMGKTGKLRPVNSCRFLQYRNTESRPRPV